MPTVTQLARLDAALRFQFACGMRLALRAGTVLAGVFVAAAGTNMEPEGTLRAASGAVLAGVDAGWGPRLGFAAVAFAVCAWAGPRLAQGDSRFVRHLPIAERMRLRALRCGVAITAAPVALVWIAGLVFGPAFGLGMHPSAALALVPMVAGVAVAAAPATNAGWSRGLGALAALASARADVVGVLCGTALVVAADAAPARLGTPVRRAVRRGRGARVRGPGALTFELKLTWRVDGARWLGLTLSTMLPLLGAWFFARNNPSASALVPGAVRFGGAVASSLVAVGVAQRVRARRAASGYMRSLPVACSTRVAADAAFVLLLAAPALAGVAALHAAALVTVLPAAGLIALRALAHARTADGAARLPFGLLAVEALLLSAASGVTAWSALPFTSLLVPAWRAAREAERALSPGRFQPGALAAGDPQAWSES